MIRCTYRGKTDDRCLLLKAQGTHQCEFFMSNNNKLYIKLSVTIYMYYNCK